MSDDGISNGYVKLDCYNKPSEIDLGSYQNRIFSHHEKQNADLSGECNGNQNSKQTNHKLSVWSWNLTHNHCAFFIVKWPLIWFYNIQIDFKPTNISSKNPNQHLQTHACSIYFLLFCAYFHFSCAAFVYRFRFKIMNESL